MRDRDTIDSELRLVAAVRSALAEDGAHMPTTAVLDELLDERNAAIPAEVGSTETSASGLSGSNPRRRRR